jgi:S-ribosylhomocysteine lyase LuxS involved in autoinducer biosynthesis
MDSRAGNARADKLVVNVVDFFSVGKKTGYVMAVIGHGTFPLQPV